MKVFNAWGIDTQFFNTLPPEALIKVRDIENSTTYKVRANLFREKGILKDFGHGEQIFLPLDKWNKQSDLEKYFKG